jgi:hypothetical protein
MVVLMSPYHGQQAIQGLDGARLVTRADAGRVRPHGAGRCIGGRARTRQGHRCRPGLPAGGVGGGQVTLVFQVLGELDHRGVELGEMLIPAARHLVAGIAADLQCAERGHHRDHDDRGEPPAAEREPRAGRAARCPGLGGESGWRAKPAQSRGDLLIVGIRPEGVLQVRGDLLLELGA